MRPGPSTSLRPSGSGPAPGPVSAAAGLPRGGSLFVRLFLANLVIVVTVIGLAGYASYRHISSSYQQQIYDHQERLLGVLRQQFEELWPLAPDRLDRLCKAAFAGGAGAAEPMRLTLVAADGQVLGDSELDPAAMANHRTGSRPELLESLAGRTGSSIRRSPSLGIDFRYLAAPLRHQGQVVGAVRLAIPAYAIAHHQALIRRTALWTTLATVGAVVLLGLLLDRLWQAPLRQLTATASQIASGDLSARAGISGPQELARLGLALNDMRESLARQIQTIRAQGQDLQTVVGNLDEGVIALDAAGRVLVLNRAAVEMFGVGKPDGTPEGTLPEAVGPVPPGLHLRAAVSTAGIVDAYNEAIASGKAVSRQLECQRDGKRMILAVQAVPLLDFGAIAGMLVARDVTELARTAGAKIEFVANASHELRTPLATIRAAVDSLADQAGDEAAVTRLAAMLDRHVARLEGLTNDLLDLHLVERKTGPLRLEDILLPELSDWAGAQFARAAGDKGLDLGVSAESPGRIRSDHKLLELILRNLLENAVKFTPPGGQVRCRMSCRQGGAVFSVQDTGCGIRAQDQKRVFERFFQADAARGGPQTRGTGLGLAIVKHAAERLGAKVELESQLGRGTTVTVTVPGCVA